jgi:hypothetical protein
LDEFLHIANTSKTRMGEWEKKSLTTTVLDTAMPPQVA